MRKIFSEMVLVKVGWRKDADCTTKQNQVRLRSKTSTRINWEDNILCTKGVSYALHISLLISKLARFSGLTPSNGPCNGFAPPPHQGGVHEVNTICIAGGGGGGSAVRSKLTSYRSPLHIPKNSMYFSQKSWILFVMCLWWALLSYSKYNAALPAI